VSGREKDKNDAVAPPAPAPITVFLADDHPLVREGLKSVLMSSGIEVVGEAADGLAAVEGVQRTHPHVVLLDVRMPGMTGLEALRTIKRSAPLTSVLMLTSYEDAGYLLEAIAGGAAGYLLKGISGHGLAGLVKRVAEGERILDQEAMAKVLRHMAEPLATRSGTDLGLSALSPREHQILQCMARGLRNREIAALLGIKESTLKTHVNHLFDKLQVSDRTQAVLWAARNGVPLGSDAPED
jgi:DNA-binding NarL/FixJ family response regulator